MYWIAQSDYNGEGTGVVYRAPKNGGSAVAMSTPDGRAYRLALSDTRVFLATREVDGGYVVKSLPPVCGSSASAISHKTPSVNPARAALGQPNPLSFSFSLCL